MRRLTLAVLLAATACGGTGDDNTVDAGGETDTTTSPAGTTTPPQDSDAGTAETTAAPDEQVATAAPSQDSDAGTAETTDAPDEQVATTNATPAPDFTLADFLTIDLTSVREEDICGVLGVALATELPSASGFEEIDATVSINADAEFVPATTLAPTLQCGWDPVSFGQSGKEYSVSIDIANTSEIDSPDEYIANGVADRLMEWDPDDYTTRTIGGFGTVVSLNDYGERVEAIFLGDAIISTNANRFTIGSNVAELLQVSRLLDRAVVSIFADLVEPPATIVEDDQIAPTSTTPSSSSITEPVEATVAPEDVDLGSTGGSRPGEEPVAVWDGEWRPAPEGREVQLGHFGQQVEWLQQALDLRGYGVDIDGYFGYGTEAAVRQFQRDRGLAVNGIATDEVWNQFGE